MSDFRIQTCVMGMVSTNCYIVYRKGGKSAVIIDPADQWSLYSEQMPGASGGAGGSAFDPRTF